MRVVRVAVNAVALLAASLLVPGIDIELTDDALGAVVVLGAIALVFGFVNASVGRAARLLAIPFRFLTLGLFTIVINAGLLLLVAVIVDVLGLDLIRLGDFPPTPDIETFVAALAGGVIIGVVSTSLNILIRDP